MLTEQKLSELRALAAAVDAATMGTERHVAIASLRAAVFDLATLRALIEGYGPDGLALTVFADIREALGVGMKPMLTELPGIVRARLEGLETELAEANTKSNTLLIGRNNLRDFRETAREYIRALEEDRKESSLAMKVANARIQELEAVAKAAHAHLMRKPNVPTRLAVVMRFAGCPLDKPFPARGKA